jgi:hypothetical protein
VGNEDRWERHMFGAVERRDYPVDQDAAKLLACGRGQSLFRSV